MKLSDFGTARIKTQQAGESTLHPNQGAGQGRAGTPYYQAPEVQMDGRQAQPHSDVWTTCLVGTEWFSGRRVWSLNNFYKMKREQSYPKQLTTDGIIPKNVREVLKEGMSYDRKARPSAANIRECLEEICRGKYSIHFISQ